MGWLESSGLVIDLFENSCKLPRIAAVQPFVTRGTQIKVSKLLVFYDVMVVVFLLGVDVYLFYSSTAYHHSVPSVSWLVQAAQQFSSTCSIVVSQFWVLRSKSTLQEALDELMKFEDKIQPKNLRVGYKMLWLTYTLLVILATLDYVMSNELGMPSIAQLVIWTRFHFAVWMMFTITSSFTSFIKIVEGCYNAITQVAITNLKATQNLRDIQIGAEHLVSACEALNAAFGPQILLITSASFVLITGNVYLAIISGLKFEILDHISWIAIFSQLMLHLITSCNSAVEAAERFEKELYRTILEDKSGNLSQEVRTCLHFTNNRKVEFNAFGFFVIDFTLAGSMIAAATTYLVILIQMSDPEKNTTNGSKTDNA